MVDLSVIIPSRNNGQSANFCTKTVEDILSKAETNIEVIVVVDESWPKSLVVDSRVHYIHPPVPQGLRACVNQGVALAKGKYIMKIDDHCMVGQGFDRILIENHKEDNWVQIPRRYALDAENWKIGNEGDSKYPIDYMYVDFPRKGKDHDDGMHGVPWKRRDRESIDIDDTPTMQGSCYFMTKNHFDNLLHGLDSTNYGQFAQESQEIGFKTWLSGGAMKVNKLTWYAHLHKGKTYGRMYKLDDADHKRGAEWSAGHWLNNREPNMTHKFEWLIDEKFPGMPSWPTDWKEQIKSMGWTQGLDILSQLAQVYGADKYGKHNYTPFYFEIFGSIRNQVKKVLEIGAGEGASLRMWQDFFPNAQIYAGDNQSNRFFQEDRIQVIKCDQSSVESLEELISITGTDIDLFIDDGSHDPDHQIITCLTVFPLLKPGAVYVIEDVADGMIVDAIRKEGFECDLVTLGKRYDDRVVILKK